MEQRPNAGVIVVVTSMSGLGTDIGYFWVRCSSYKGGSWLLVALVTTSLLLQNPAPSHVSMKEVGLFIDLSSSALASLSCAITQSLCFVSQLIRLNRKMAEKPIVRSFQDMPPPGGYPRVWK
jgi:hypothetical protein